MMQCCPPLLFEPPLYVRAWFMLIRQSTFRVVFCLVVGSVSAAAAQPQPRALPPGAPRATPAPEYVAPEYVAPGTVSSLAVPPVVVDPAPMPLEGPALPAAEHCRRVPRSTGLVSTWRYRVRPWLQATHWGYPENFQAPPLGASVYGHMNAQVANGQAAQLVLYRFDFHDGATGPVAALNPYGRKRLRKLAGLLWASPLPLVIEASPYDDEQVHVARRLAVLEELAKILPEAVPPERVVVAELDDPGLAGEEAELVYRNLLEQTRQAPRVLPTGSGSDDGVGFTPRFGLPIAR